MHFITFFEVSLWLKYHLQHLYLYDCPRQRIRHDLQHGSPGHGPRGPDRLGLPRSLLPGHYRVRVSPTSSRLGITSTLERTAPVHGGRDPDIERSRPRLSDPADVYAIWRIESICAHGRYDLGKTQSNKLLSLANRGASPSLDDILHTKFDSSIRSRFVGIKHHA